MDRTFFEKELADKNQIFMAELRRQNMKDVNREY
jgi:hypothetical protein